MHRHDSGSRLKALLEKESPIRFPRDDPRCDLDGQFKWIEGSKRVVMDQSLRKVPLPFWWVIGLDWRMKSGRKEERGLCIGGVFLFPESSRTGILVWIYPPRRNTARTWGPCCKVQGYLEPRAHQSETHDQIRWKKPVWIIAPIGGTWGPQLQDRVDLGVTWHATSTAHITDNLSGRSDAHYEIEIPTRGTKPPAPTSGYVEFCR